MCYDYDRIDLFAIIKITFAINFLNIVSQTMKKALEPKHRGHIAAPKYVMFQ